MGQSLGGIEGKLAAAAVVNHKRSLSQGAIGRLLGFALCPP
jgi:hypothetical protein